MNKQIKYNSETSVNLICMHIYKHVCVRMHMCARVCICVNKDNDYFAKIRYNGFKHTCLFSLYFHRTKSGYVYIIICI